MAEAVAENLSVVEPAPVEKPEGCICYPPCVAAADKAQHIFETTNGHNAVMPWDAMLPLSMFGAIIARSIAEKKHYAGFLSRTHKQCPVHDAVFWPRLAEEAAEAAPVPEEKP